MKELVDSLLSVLHPTDPSVLMLQDATRRARADTTAKNIIGADTKLHSHLAHLVRSWRSLLPEAETGVRALVHLRCALGHGRPARPDGVRVLSLDGGGTRALLTIELLKSLEKSSGSRICEMFDVIGGTSTGGILALGIQVRHATRPDLSTCSAFPLHVGPDMYMCMFMSPHWRWFMSPHWTCHHLQEGIPLDELERLYLKLANRVFRRTAQPRRYGQILLTGAAYNEKDLEAILQEVHRSLRMLHSTAFIGMDHRLSRSICASRTCAGVCSRSSWFSTDRSKREASRRVAPSTSTL